jgi:hypothetical protein
MHRNRARGLERMMQIKAADAAMPIGRAEARAVGRRRQGRVEIQIVGAIRREEAWAALGDLPVRAVFPQPEEHEYPLFMLWFTSTVRWDVGIGPLRDTPFTRCKSDVKFLDYAAIGVAGAFSRVAPYDGAEEGSPRHLESAYLVENSPEAWEDALETLLGDDELRLHLARGAVRSLRRDRILARRAGEWSAAVRRWLA